MQKIYSSMCRHLPIRMPACLCCRIGRQTLIIRAMRITIFLTLACVVNLYATGYSQEKLSINLKEVKLSQVFNVIQQKTDYQFLYNDEAVESAPLVSISVKDATVAQILADCFKDYPLSYRIENKTVVVLPKLTLPVKLPEAPVVKRPAIVIKGRVVDSLGNPLVGVSVSLKGSSTGTVTDGSGKYELSLDNGNGTLVFSYVGYLKQEIAIGGRPTINVTMHSSISSLDQLVVVGYGTQKKKDLTGSIAIIDESQLKNKFFTNATEALRGAKGVYVFQPGAQPGKGSVTVQIRGQGTLNNNNPLVLVDGVEYDMSNVDPNNIKSISVLKDASAAAIYGARAANGVILVTTKDGEGAEGFHISYDNYFGVSQAINLPDYVKDPIRFFELRNQAQRNAGDATVTYSDQLIEEYKEGMKTDPLTYPQTDWYKIALRKAFVQKHNVRLYGSNGAYNYSLAMGYNEQNGILKGTGSNKYSLNLNTSIKATDRLTIKAIIDGQLNNYYEPPAGASYLMDQVNREASVPYDPVFTKDGKYADNFVRTPGHNAYRHPLAIINEGINKHKEQSYRISLEGEYRFPANFTYDVLVGYTKEDYLQQIFEPEIFQYNIKTDAPVRTLLSGSPIRHAQNSDTYNYQTNFQHTLTWEMTTGDHNLFALLGNSLQSVDNNNFFGRKEGYLGNDLTSLNAGSTNPDDGGTYSKTTLVSLFGRLRYNYQGKYLFEADFREDGSSMFAQGHKWGLFPSFSAGWQIRNEDFMQNISWIDALKLRASWGRLGNNRIASYRYVNLVDLGEDYSFGDDISSGGAITTYNDPNITWETTTTSNIGLDGTFFGNRLNLSFEVYNKKTTDILHEVTLPGQVGNLNGPIENIGTVANKGIEANLSYQNSIGDFHYQIGGDISTVRNKVLALNGQTIYNYGWRNNGGTIIKEGYPIDAFYVIHYTGIFQSEEEIQKHPFQSADTKPGYLKFEDANGDGKIDADDRVISDKSRIPKYTYAFNLHLSYKRINLSAMFSGVGKVYSYSNYYGIVPFWYGSGVTEYWVKNAWTPDHTDAKLPILTTYEDGATTNFRDSDFLLYNVSYLRLKNLQISYELPVNLMKRLHFSSAEVFVSGDNLLTITPLPYYDPEKNLTDQTFNGYPTSLTLTVGLRVNL